MINLDTACADQLVTHAQEQGSRVVTFGESAEALVRLVDYQPATRHAVIEVEGERIELTIGAEGRHMALNSLAVLATLRALDIPDWQRALRSLESFQALAGRGQTSTVDISGGALTLIDESYNANPASIRAALDAMANRPVADGGRKIVVLADMLELGAHAAEIHEGLAPAFDPLTDSEVHLFGENMAALATALEGRIPSLTHWRSLEELKGRLIADLKPGDVILLKGSNGMNLGSIVKGLQSLEGPQSPEARQSPEPVASDAPTRRRWPFRRPGRNRAHRGTS